MSRSSTRADIEQGEMLEKHIEWDTPMYRVAVGQLDQTAELMAHSGNHTPVADRQISALFELRQGTGKLRSC